MSRHALLLAPAKGLPVPPYISCSGLTWSIKEGSKAEADLVCCARTVILRHRPGGYFISRTACSHHRAWHKMMGCCVFECMTQSAKGKALFAATLSKFSAKCRKVWLQRVGVKPLPAKFTQPLLLSCNTTCDSRADCNHLVFGCPCEAVSCKLASVPIILCI